MKILHFKIAFLLFYPGSLDYANEQACQNQFNFCWTKTIDNCDKNQNFSCLSGRLKLGDLSYSKNDTAVCASTGSCDISECCNGNTYYPFNTSQALAVYTNCSYETNCSVYWADEIFVTPGFQGHANNIVNYTCIEDYMVLKICGDNAMTANKVELVLDGKHPEAVSSGPAKCECSLSTEPENGNFSVDLTDLRFTKPSNSSCSTAKLNIFGLPIRNCSAGPFQYKGVYMFNSNDSDKLSIEHLFESGVEDIPSMIWITIRGNSNAITVNCSAIQTKHNVTYYTDSTPRQSTSSSHHTLCTKMPTTQDDRTPFSATKATETTGTTKAMGTLTHAIVSEISITLGNSNSVTVNSSATRTVHNGTYYSSERQTAPTKLPPTQDDRASFSSSNIAETTVKTKADGTVTNVSLSETSVILGYSNSAKVNIFATQKIHSVNYNTSPTRPQTTPTSRHTPSTKLQTTQDDSTSFSLSGVAEATGTPKPEGTVTNASVSETSIILADNDNMVLIIKIVVPIVGSVVIIISIISAIIFIRRRRKHKQLLRTIDFEVESYGENYRLFPLESTSNLRRNVHNYDDTGDFQNRGSDLFSDEGINTSRLTVQEYDHITFEKLPRKRIPNYDLMMEGVHIPPLDITDSHTTSETLSSKYFKADGYSHINFDKTRSIDQKSAKVNRNTTFKEKDCYLHIDLESKPAFLNVNPTGKTEPIMNDNDSNPANIQSTDYDQGKYSSDRPETILDGDSYSRIDFNAKQSSDVNDLEMPIRVEKGNENYNYTKVNLEHKKRKLRESMEDVQISEV